MDALICCPGTRHHTARQHHVNQSPAPSTRAVPTTYLVGCGMCRAPNPLGLDRGVVVFVTFNLFLVPYLPTSRVALLTSCECYRSRLACRIHLPPYLPYLPTLPTYLASYYLPACSSDCLEYVSARTCAPTFYSGCARTAASLFPETTPPSSPLRGVPVPVCQRQKTKHLVLTVRG